jgi:hypothetical protein
MARIVIDLDTALAPNGNYYVTVDEGFVVDAVTGEPNPAITDKNAITFTAQPEFEFTEFVPEDDATGFRFDTVSKSRRIDVIFEQDVFKGSGFITLYNTADPDNPVPIETFDVATDVFFRFSPPSAPNTLGRRITIYATDFFTGRDHKLIVDDGALLDGKCMSNRELVGFDGLAVDNITVDMKHQELLASTPVGEDIDSETGLITVEYCKPVVINTGNFYLYDSTDQLIEIIPVDRSPNFVGNNKDGVSSVLHLFPQYRLDEFTEYYVTSDREVVDDTAGFSNGPLVKNDSSVTVLVYKPRFKGQLIIQFNRDVKSSEDYPAEGKVYLRRLADQATVKTWDVKWNQSWLGSANPFAAATDSPVIVQDDLIEYIDNRAFLTASLAQGVNYYILIDTGAFKDIDQIPAPGVVEILDWSFSTYNGPIIESVDQLGTGSQYVRLNWNDPVAVNINSESDPRAPKIVDFTTNEIEVRRTSGNVLESIIPAENIFAGEMFGQQLAFDNKVNFDHGVFGPYDLNCHILIGAEYFSNDKGFRHLGVANTTLPIQVNNSILKQYPALAGTGGRFTVAVNPGESLAYAPDELGGFVGITLQFDRQIQVPEQNKTISIKDFATNGATYNTTYTIVGGGNGEILSQGGIANGGFRESPDFNTAVDYFDTALPKFNQINIPLRLDTINIGDRFYVEVDSGAVVDFRGVEFRGINDKTVANFFIGDLDAINYLPRRASENVIFGFRQVGPFGTPQLPDFFITFNEPVNANSAAGQRIRLRRADNDQLVLSLDGSDITIINNLDGLPFRNRAGFNISPNTPLSSDTEYYITVDAGMFVPTSPGSTPFPGISDKNFWRFRTFSMGAVFGSTINAVRISEFSAALDVSTTLSASAYQAELKVITSLNAEAQYNLGGLSAVLPVTTSLTSTVSEAFGGFIQGGYLAGYIIDDGQRYGIVVAPRQLGESSNFLEIANFEVESVPEGILTFTNGPAATAAMVALGNASKFPAAHFCNNLNINGFTDWYLPARDELELCYRNLKPIDMSNDITFRGFPPNPTDPLPGTNDEFGDTHGINRNSDPIGAAYTLNEPFQTPATIFQRPPVGPEAPGALAGEQAFASEYTNFNVLSRYLTSSIFQPGPNQFPTPNAWVQEFGEPDFAGNQSIQQRPAALVRAVRRFPA